MVKKITLYLWATVALLAVFPGCSRRIAASVPASVEDGAIVLKTPAREPGQQSALLLASDPLDTVRVGFVGIGMRGLAAVKRFTFLENTRTVALCDIYPDRVEKAQEILAEAGAGMVAEYTGEDGWKQLCERPDIDLVYICTDWIKHTPMAVYAMEHGKHAAVEVPAAMSIEECWQLVNTCEKTRRHCMMLENCVYDFFEASALNMAQQGLFGEVYHVEGGYVHNLDPYWDRYADNWRLAYNTTHRGDNYPTHGIGPVCQVLNIHRGDRMDYLVSMDTDSFHGLELARERGGESFADGDHTVTLIRTAKGRQIEIQHNVYGARPYSRLYQLTGTKGFANKYPSQGLTVDGRRISSGEETDALLETYRPEIIREIEDLARKVGGHGGMDFIMDYRLVYCLRHGLPLDQDVYDAAEWSCLTELSGLSIENGSAPVRVPDFTRGDWNRIDGYSYAIK